MAEYAGLVEQNRLISKLIRPFEIFITITQT